MLTKNILICGGSRGLGYEMVKNLLARDNFKIIVVSRNAKKLTRIKKIKSKNLDHYICDLSKEKRIVDLMKKLKKKYSSIDLVISTAGTSNMVNTGKENYKEWLRAFNSNFFLQTNLVESFVKSFRGRKLKKIILVSSIAAYFKGGAPLSYSLAKNALNLYVENISIYLSKFNININTISPGHILQKNNLWGKKINKNRKKVIKFINKTVSLKRFCSPQDVINVVDFLMSDKSNYITGVDFKVDGKTS